MNCKFFVGFDFIYRNTSELELESQYEKKKCKTVQKI